MLKNRFMKKIVFTLGFALIGSFVFGNDQLTNEDFRENEEIVYEFMRLPCSSWTTVHSCTTYYLCNDHYIDEDGFLDFQALWDDTEYWDGVKGC